MLTTAGFRPPGRPGRNPLPPGGVQREIRLLQGLRKWGQGRDPTPPPDLPPQSPHHHLPRCLTRAHPGAPPLISLHLCHFSSCGCSRLILPPFSPPILVNVSQLVSLLSVWTTTLVSTQRLSAHSLIHFYTCSHPGNTHPDQEAEHFCLRNPIPQS